MKLPCELVQDLLPLYHDGVCSEVSEQLVNDHLQGCENCRDALRAIDIEINVPKNEMDAAKPLKSIEQAWRRKVWLAFSKWFTIVVGSISLFFASFCLLTQWKCITLSPEGISVKEMYTLPDGVIVYRLENIPEDVWNSTWEFIVTEDGCSYKIPKRSVIELTQNTQPNQLALEQMIDPGENNAVQGKLGGPKITKWYIGEPGDAILIWEEGMEAPPATEKQLLRYGYDAG